MLRTLPVEVFLTLRTSSGIPEPRPTKYKRRSRFDRPEGRQDQLRGIKAARSLPRALKCDRAGRARSRIDTDY